MPWRENFCSIFLISLGEYLTEKPLSFHSDFDRFLQRKCSKPKRSYCPGSWGGVREPQLKSGLINIHPKNSDESDVTMILTFFTTKFELKQVGLPEYSNIQGFYQPKAGLDYLIQYQGMPGFSDEHQRAAKGGGLFVIS